MLLTLERRLRSALTAHIAARYGVDTDVALALPRHPSHGDLASPVCFALAKRLRRAPRQIAAELCAELPPVRGIRSLEAAGAGYVNVRFDRAAYFAGVLAGRRPAAAVGTKAIVEHTNINPNKAAHIGHLRNAVLGDTLVRMLRALGRPVEVQNYIDNTGVQVADVVAAFRFARGMGADEVRALVRDPAIRFDHYCWDLYAEISQRFAAKDPRALEWRAETLKALESGEGELAKLGKLVADAIVACHLATMRRIGVKYDVLPRESEILRLRFWSAAFALLKSRGAIRYETSGKNVGCWVMPSEMFRAAAPKAATGTEAQGTDGDGAKVIVRSDGTVTYVGKDIAYQLWKFGLLEGRSFRYVPMPDPDGAVWRTTDGESSPAAPSFGGADEVFNVIDVRQSYLQDVVRAALKSLGFRRQARRSVHFDYEMVALSPRCCAELGIRLTEEERSKPYVEVSGRKGLGVKADDLVDLLTEAALEEVRSRHSELAGSECRSIADEIAVGALRYFMLRFTRNTVIAFDFQEALAFEGETGPYLQYAAVRAKNILRKHAESVAPGTAVPEVPAREAIGRQLEDEQLWQLVRSMSLSEWAVARAAEAGEPAQVARQAFQAAQSFNNFYHRTHILRESDPERQAVQLAIVRMALADLSRLMRVMGVPVPERM